MCQGNGQFSSQADTIVDPWELDDRLISHDPLPVPDTGSDSDLDELDRDVGSSHLPFSHLNTPNHVLSDLYGTVTDATYATARHHLTNGLPGYTDSDHSIRDLMDGLTSPPLGYGAVSHLSPQSRQALRDLINSTELRLNNTRNHDLAPPNR
jgi:hypothetical protein